MNSDLNPTNANFQPAHVSRNAKPPPNAPAHIRIAFRAIFAGSEANSLSRKWPASARFFYWERRLMQALGAWTLSIPEFEVKLETGRHIFYHADVARSVRERLHEQEFRLADIDNHRDADIDRFIEEMLSASSPAELLVGVHQVAGRALEVAIAITSMTPMPSPTRPLSGCSAGR